MSDMNAELLTKGCLYLRDIVNSLNIKDESVRGAIAEGVTAGVESEIESIKDNTENTLLRTYKELEGVDMRNSKTEIKVEAREEVRLKDTPKSAPPKVEKKEMVIIDDRKSSRRDQVLSLLSKDPISIKDISEKIVGCSEKTIQRELNALVDAQKITRIGEKRWSRYTLAR
jgi:DNA-binding HxlR family transcriptional regulator